MKMIPASSRDKIPMLNGIMLLWFSLTAMAVVFVAIDIKSTESPVLKWGFVLLTAYTGPVSCMPKTLSVLISRMNHLTSVDYVRTVLLRPGRFGLAIQVEEAT
jgi:hypothetical protein